MSIHFGSRSKNHSQNVLLDILSMNLNIVLPLKKDGLQNECEGLPKTIHAILP